MDMQNMAITPAEAKEEMAEYSDPSQGPKYPYGLSLCLDDDCLEKLNMPAMPAVGSTMMLTARVEVCEVSQYQRSDGTGNSTLRLQITEMALNADNSQKPMAERMYGA